MVRAVTPRSEELADVGTVLLLAPDAPAEHACESLLGSGATEPRAVHVAYEPTPDECLARWRDVPASPAAVEVIAVGDRARSAAAEGASVGPVSVQPVAEPADLTGIDIALSDVLSRWSGTAVVACVDSLSAMLEHASVERTFRFLNDVTVRLKRADAHAHVHLDPSRHDEATVNALAGLFDAALELAGDGSRTVRRRVPLTG